MRMLSDFANKLQNPVIRISHASLMRYTTVAIPIYVNLINIAVVSPMKYKLQLKWQNKKATSMRY